MAGRMAGQIPENVKKQRQEQIMLLQKGISAEILREKIGSEVEVLVEGSHEDSDFLLKGRAAWQAPDVDGLVIINAGNPKIGSFEKLRIIDAMEYDLLAESISPQTSNSLH